MPTMESVSRITKGKVIEVTKRDGRKEEFSSKKIAEAVRKCFINGTYLPEESGRVVGEQIALSVLNILRKEAKNVDVETLQRLVIQQLWANSHFDAAEHYTLYREERRKRREQEPISQEHFQQIEEDSKHFPTDLQYYQFLGKFSRWREKDARRETWKETCERVFNWLKKLPLVKDKITQEEWNSLFDAMHSLEVSPAMRVVQMAGPALDRCNVGALNCAYAPIIDLFSFVELLYVLMQGTGMGFSVESEYISQLPRVKKQKAKKVVYKHIVEDSTEGWCDAYYFGLQKWFAGEDVEFDNSRVRPAGARLKTKGGRASGPEPLRELLTFAKTLILKKQGNYLSDLDCHDLCCMTGKIVQVGGVRRASCISLSDLDSQEMRTCKTGNWWEKSIYRTMANNSACYDEKPEAVEFLEEWLSLAKSGSGERGIFNRVAVLKGLPSRRKKWKFGGNPCLEIILRPNQFCNLSIVVAKGYDTEESLLKKVELAAFFGVIQSTATDFKYIREDWKVNCEEERLLGVDVTGHADCPLLRFGAPGRKELLNKLKQRVADTAEQLCKRLSINRSAADTCVKPGGDSGVFFDCASGVSPRFSEYQVRWVRESIHSPIAKYLKDEGVSWAVAPEDKSLLVFAFPKKAPEGVTLRNDLTALQQLENWLEWKTCWAEHSVSATIYVESHEWIEVGNWVYQNFDSISGLSFLPKDNGNYRYAPNEEITREEYEKMVDSFPKLNWAKLSRYEKEDMTEASQTYACSSGTCEI